MSKELFEAIQQGDSARANALLDAEPALADAKDDAGVSYLLQALYHRQPEIAEAIAARRGEQLELAEAVALGRLDLVGTTLDSSPDAVSAHTPDGFTPLHLAAFFGREEVAALLLARGAEVNAVAANPTKVRPLHSAAAIGSVAICRRLLEAGAEPDAQQHGGYTALMSAAMHGNEELVDLLLAHGASLDPTAEDARAARDFAREGGFEELAARL